MRGSGRTMEALNAKQKHGEFLVDVDSMPRVADDGIVVRLASLEELFKAAEALFKPVLHRAEPHQHVYFVLDTGTLYLDTNVQSSELEAEAPLTEDAPEVVNSTLSVESELLRETPPVEDEFLFDSMSPTD